MLESNQLHYFQNKYALPIELITLKCSFVSDIFCTPGRLRSGPLSLERAACSPVHYGSNEFHYLLMNQEDGIKNLHFSRCSVSGDPNANPHVFFPLFYKVVRINLLGGNHPHFIYCMLVFKNVATLGLEPRRTLRSKGLIKVLGTNQSLCILP